MIAKPETIEQQLLHAALLCDLSPGKSAVYRLQLFLVANRDLGSSSHQSAFQRALETAVDKKGLFENHETRGSGEYILTLRGAEVAKTSIGEIEARYKPARKNEFRAKMRGIVERINVEIVTRGTKTIVYFNNERVPSAAEACRRLEVVANTHLPTQGDSAVRVLQDFGIDRRFEIQFE